MLLMCVATLFSANAETKQAVMDTVGVKNTELTFFKESSEQKGKTLTTYYAFYKGSFIKASKEVVKVDSLAHKHNIQAAMAIVYKNHKPYKIILD